MDQTVRGDSVEGESASRTVHIYCYSVRGGGRVGANRCSSVIVPRKVIIIRAVQTPGRIIPSQPAVHTLPSPSDSSVRQTDVDRSFPLHFPVTATSQRTSTQQLEPAVKPLWVISTLARLGHNCRFSFVTGQMKLSVCCGWVQPQITGI